MQMTNIIEVSDEEQFAKGQSSRDLQVSSDARDWRFSLWKRSTLSDDFFRFLEFQRE